jgi:ribonuclease R
MEASKIDFRLVQGPQRATERVGKTARDKLAGDAVVPVRTEKPKAATPKPGKAKTSKPPKAEKAAKPSKSAVGGVKKKAKARV